jgi:hypothetical protein
MCFSATASFAATGVTSLAGAAALHGAQRRSQMLLAAIPILFAVHQFAEGVLWLGLTQPQHAAWQRPAMFTFLFFAEVVWPTWVPLAMLALEEDPGRRKVLRALLALGIVLSLVRVYGLVAYPVSAAISGSHIQYRLDAPFALRRLGDVCYAIVTVVPPFVSSTKLVRWIGVLILVSAVASKLLFYETFISTWCFFAALISALVVVAARSRRGLRSQPEPSSAAAA